MISGGKWREPGSCSAGLISLKMPLSQGALFDSKEAICTAAISFNNLLGKAHYAKKSCTKQMVLLCSSCCQKGSLSPLQNCLRLLRFCKPSNTWRLEDQQVLFVSLVREKRENEILHLGLTRCCLWNHTTLRAQWLG